MLGDNYKISAIRVTKSFMMTLGCSALTFFERHFWMVCHKQAGVDTLFSSRWDSVT